MSHAIAVTVGIATLEVVDEYISYLEQLFRLGRSNIEKEVCWSTQLECVGFGKQNDIN